jgi:putative endonuclease
MSRAVILARLLRAAVRHVGTAGGARSDAALGAQGEEIAYWYLRERGFTMVARNYRGAAGGGEVDLIGWEGGTLVFVEVKTRESAEVRRAEDAVDFSKRRHLVSAARDYCRRARVQAPHRFDVVSVYPRPGEEPLVEHFRDAFTEADAAG